MNFSHNSLANRAEWLILNAKVMKSFAFLSKTVQKQSKNGPNTITYRVPKIVNTFLLIIVEGI